MFFFRATLTFVYFVDVVRQIVLVAFIPMTFIEVAKQNINCIFKQKINLSHRHFSYKGFDEFLINYLQLLLSINFLDKLIQNLAFSIMGCGLLGQMLSTFGCIKMWNSLPFIVYLVALFCVILIPAWTHIAVPDLTNLHEVSKTSLFHLKNRWTILFSIQSSRRKYLMKKFKSIQPVRIHGGVDGYRMYALKKETKSAYYALLIFHSTNVLILIPDKLLI